jgi:protein-L-isoaspartate(D-aspartate) O-methyltransferase
MARDIGRSVRQRAPTVDGTALARVLSAISAVPRDAFVPTEYRRLAYRETPLSIGYKQTISDAYLVAVMTMMASIPDKANVLDVGTGSGYQAAVLAQMGARVTSIEIVKPLADTARDRLAALGYRNVEVRASDGYLGAPDRAPFDAIIVAAESDKLPPALLDQVKIGGRIIMPVGPQWANEQLLVITKIGRDSIERCTLGWVMFVPLTGLGERPSNSIGLFDTGIKPCFDGPLVTPIFARSPPQPRRVR